MAEVYPYRIDEYDEYDDAYDDEYAEKLNNLNEDDESIASFDSYKTTSQYHEQQAEIALQNLKFVVKEPGWKKVLQHKSGTKIYSKLGITADDKMPVFMGKHVIEGFTPRAIFAVIGMRKLWDDWYEEGNLVENLNDTTSLTYMVMQALAGSKARDLSLVEKIECAQNGTIYFIATSVETPKVPRVPNRIRAQLNLNGWILEPLSYNPARTKVTYVLQTMIKGWVPSIVSKTYLARRPLVLHTIDQYLQRNGPPPMVLSSTSPESSRPSRAHSDSDTSSTYQDDTTKDNNLDFTKVRYQRMKISFTDLNESSAKQLDGVAPVSPIRTAGKIQKDSLHRQSEPISLSSPRSPTSPTSHRSLTSPTSHRSLRTLRSLKYPISPVSPAPPSPTSPTSPTSETFFNTSSRPRSSARPIQHRHSASVQRALEIFKSYVSLDGWDFQFERKSVKTYTREVAGKSTPIMRGDAVIFGGFTTYDILSVIKNLDTRKLWDERFDEGAIYETFGLHELLMRTATKGIFPISGRDFSACSTLDLDEDTGTLKFVITSVVDPLIPESKKHVRGHLGCLGWQLKPHFDSNGKIISVEVVYIIDVDIKLDIVPSSIRKTLSEQIPMNVAKIDELMQRKGFSPYVLNSTTKIIKEEFNDKNDQYDISLIAEDGGVTEFKISKLMYPNGVEVFTIPENCKVELLPNSTDVIRVTLPLRVDLDTLIVTISKHSKDFQMTYNYGQIIPTASSSQIIPTASSSQIIPTASNSRIIPIASNSQIIPTASNSQIIPTASNSQIIPTASNSQIIPTASNSQIIPTASNSQIISTASNSPRSLSIEKPAEITQNISTRSKHLSHRNENHFINNEFGNVTNNDKSNGVRPSRKHKSLISRNMITSKLFVNPSEVSLKSEPYQRMLEKQTLLENKIAAVTRASRENLAFLEVKPETKEFRASHDNLAPLEVESKTEESQTSYENLAPLEVEPKTEESQTSHDNLAPLEVEPKTEESQTSHDNLAPLEVEPKTEESQTSHDNLAPLEVKPKTEESQTSHDNLAPSEVKPKTEESQASHDNLAPLEVKPKIEVEKSENEVIENNINDTIALNNPQDMVVTIRFNSHQLGLMFASMLLAYYLGKLSN